MRNLKEIGFAEAPVEPASALALDAIGTLRVGDDAPGQRAEYTGFSTVVHAEGDESLECFSPEMQEVTPVVPAPEQPVQVSDSVAAERSITPTTVLSLTIPARPICAPQGSSSVSPEEPIMAVSASLRRKSLDRLASAGVVAAAIVLCGFLGYAGVRRYRTTTVMSPEGPRTREAVPGVLHPASPVAFDVLLRPVIAASHVPAPVPDERLSRAPGGDSEAEVPEERPSERGATGTLGQSLPGTVAPEPASPALAATSSAVFIRDSSTLADGRADSSPERQGLRIVTVGESGASNYHPRLSPDERLVAFDSDRDGERGVYLANRDGTDVRRVSGAGVAAVPSWSPDGKRLSFLRAEPHRPDVWNLWVWAVATDALTRVTSYRAGKISGGGWLPDSRRLCYSYDTQLVIADAGALHQPGTRLTALNSYPSPRPGRALGMPAVSPDGKRVVFQVEGDGVWITDLQTREARRILEDVSVDEVVWDADGRRLAYRSGRDDEWRIWVALPPS